MKGRPSHILYVLSLFILFLHSLSQWMEAGTVENEPGGRVEGRVWVGGKPMGEGKVILERNEPPPFREERDSHDPYTTTVRDGCFLFEDVDPGEWRVGVLKEVPVLNEQGFHPTWSSSHSVPFRLNKGQTVKVKIGGVGRPVVGRLIPPKGESTRIAYQGSSFRRVWLNIPQTACPKGLSMKGRKAWFRKHYSSEKGLAEWHARRSYIIDVGSEGRFRIEDVPAGSYTGEIEVSRWGEMLDYGSGGVGLSFTVPEIPGGRSDETLDLGEIEIQFKKPDRLKLGDPAPDIEVVSLDGQHVKLSEHRGHYVLLDFWATWCEPCRKQVPHLKALWDRFGEDPRFEMIGLSFDTSVKELREYMRTHGLAWTQAVVEKGFKSDLAELYDIRSIPTILLVGPDGKIVATKLHGKRIVEAVEAALKKN